MSLYRGKTVALALGGGGARGLAHICVLEALDELGVRPVAIAGASIGAIVGAAYAAGFSGAELRAHTQAILKNRIGLCAPAASCAGAGAKAAAVPRRASAAIRRRALSSPLLARRHARTLRRSKHSAAGRRDRFSPPHRGGFRHGSAGAAVAGSMAIPGIVRAATSDHGYFVDGGLVNPLPYDHLWGLADIVIAVDVSGNFGVETGRPPSALRDDDRREPDHDERDHARA